MNLIHLFSILTTTHIGLIVFGLLGVGLYIVVKVWSNLKQEDENLKLAESELSGFASSVEATKLDSSDDIIAFRLSERIQRKIERGRFSLVWEHLTKFFKFRKNGETAGEDSLVWERVRVLEQVRENAGRFERSSISEVTRSRLRAQTASLRYIAGILILIGLFGTLCGLTGAVSGLGGAIDITKQQQLKTSAEVDRFLSTLRDEIGRTLAGMRMAFVASLFGVFSTIILTAFVSWLNRKQLKFLADLEEFTTIRLMPQYIPKGEAASLQKIADHFHENAIQLEKVFQKFKVDYAQKDQIVSGVATISEAVNDFVNESLSRDEGIYIQLKDSINNLVNITEGSETALNATENAINNLETAMQQIMGGEVSTRDEFLNKLSESFQEHSKDLEKIFSKIKDTLMAQYEQTKESVNLVSNSSIEISKSLSQLISFEETNKNLLSQMKDDIVAADRFKEISNEMKSQTEILSSAFGSNGNDNNINALLASINLNLSENNERVDGVNKETNSLLTSINSNLSQNSNLLGGLNKEINLLPRNIMNLIEQAQKNAEEKRKRPPSKVPVGDVSVALTSLIEYIYRQESRRISNRIKGLFESIARLVRSVSRKIKRFLRPSKYD